MKKKIFLGGTCNGSTWRNQLIPQLTTEYFNPVVEEWSDECYEEELRQRENCDICLYVITPKMTGVYSIAEVIDDSNKRPEKTVFHFMQKDGKSEFDDFQMNSLTNVGKMVTLNGGYWAKSAEELITFLNK
jgi:hypothetical protein